MYIYHILKSDFLCVYVGVNVCMIDHTLKCFLVVESSKKLKKPRFKERVAWNQNMPEM